VSIKDSQVDCPARLKQLAGLPLLPGDCLTLFEHTAMLSVRQAGAHCYCHG
jgi:hypothetical protein